MEGWELTKDIFAGIGALAVLSTAGQAYFMSRWMKKNRLHQKDLIVRVSLSGPIGIGSAIPMLSSVKAGIHYEGVEKLVENAKTLQAKGIIFEINSPGGAVLPSKQIGELIKKIEVPTVAVVGDYAASGGYWIASACDHIIADEMSLVGSIGVIMEHFEASELLQRLGVKYTPIHSGEFKGAGSMWKPMEKEVRNHLQGNSDYVYRAFLNEISKNRDLDVGHIQNLANGFVYHAEQAKEAGLIDGFGGVEEAVKYIAAEAKLESYDVRKITPPQPSLLKRLTSGNVLHETSYVLGRSMAEGLVERVSEDNLKYKI